MRIYTTTYTNIIEAPYYQPFAIEISSQRTSNAEIVSMPCTGCHDHYDDVIMSAIPSQITSLTIVYSTVYPGADESKHQSSVSLAFVWGIHRGPVNSPHKWPVTRKMFPFDDVIMMPPSNLNMSSSLTALPSQVNTPAVVVSDGPLGWSVCVDVVTSRVVPTISILWLINSSPPGQIGSKITDNDIKCNFINEKGSISIFFIEVCPYGCNRWDVIIGLAWRRTGDKPLS